MNPFCEETKTPFVSIYQTITSIRSLRKRSLSEEEGFKWATQIRFTVWPENIHQENCWWQHWSWTSIQSRMHSTGRYRISVVIIFLSSSRVSSQFWTGHFTHKWHLTKCVILSSIISWIVFHSSTNRRFEQLTGKRKTQAQRVNFSYVFATALMNDSVIVPNKTLDGEPWWFPIKGATWDKVRTTPWYIYLMHRGMIG